jgi:uncharacterized protein (DUF1778 family)
MKDHHLRARLPGDEYQALKKDADGQGLTISEFVRNVILCHRQAVAQEQFLAQVGNTLAALSAAPAAAPTGTDSEPLLAELLFLVRELVAERNAQVLGRVANQLNSLYPQRKKL